MKDSSNRTIDYVRLSITDRCNLRCVYCMPESGIDFLPHEKIMTYEEIIRVCQVMASLGMRKVKLTGGEPLVRKDVSWLVAQLKAIKGVDSVTLTTNGMLLKKQVADLAKAGLNSVNISLDTLDRVQYQKLTRFDALEEVLMGIREALTYPHLSVKLNCVPVKEKGVSNQIPALVQMAEHERLHIRFIELMPIGLGKEMEGWSEEEIRSSIIDRFGELIPFQKPLGNGPCVYYSLKGFEGKIGFISAISHKFCDKCNRIRVTSEGILKTCLQYGGGTDLKAAMSSGLDDERLALLIKESIWNKPKEHQFGSADGLLQGEQKKMFRIGG